MKHGKTQRIRLQYVHRLCDNRLLPADQFLFGEGTKNEQRKIREVLLVPLLRDFCHPGLHNP